MEQEKISKEREYARRVTQEAVDAGEFPWLHCEVCDWPWTDHQEDAHPLTRITTHEFVTPKIVLET